MKKLILGMILLSFALAANPNIKSTMTNYRVDNGYQYVSMEVIAEPAYAGVTPSALVWYADAIAGFSSIDFYGMAVSTGSVPTTIDAQAIRTDGTAIGAVQTLTSGTDLTDIRSPRYKFTLPAAAVTRNVTFTFLIAD